MLNSYEKLRTGSILNASNFGRALGISHNTVREYLDLLVGGFVLSALEPFHINTKKRLVKAPKLYIRDSGILHRLQRVRSMEHLHEQLHLGASWEGYVIEQIRRVGGPEWGYSFYRTHTGSEVDLVLLTPSQQRLCVEIKYSSAPTLSSGTYEALRTLEPTASYIIVPTGPRYVREEGIEVISLTGFLREVVLAKKICNKK